MWVNHVHLSRRASNRATGPKRCRRAGPRPARRPPARRPPRGRRGRFLSCCHGIWQTLHGSFSAVSRPIFASKYAFESSRRDLHNALLCKAFESKWKNPWKTTPLTPKPTTKKRGKKKRSAISIVCLKCFFFYVAQIQTI